MQHRRHGEKGSSIPRVWLDYRFLSLMDIILTVLCLLEDSSGAVVAAVVPEKGPAEYAVRVVTQALEHWGLKRVVLVAVGEPVMQALLNAVRAARQEETVVTSAPRKDSRSKGPIDN